jgi:hypothetical protein
MNEGMIEVFRLCIRAALDPILQLPRPWQDRFPVGQRDEGRARYLYLLVKQVPVEKIEELARERVVRFAIKVGETQTEFEVRLPEDKPLTDLVQRDFAMRRIDP